MRNPLTLLRRLPKALLWTRDSYLILSAFLATVALIAVVWWPLAVDAMAYLDLNRPIWIQLDWLLLGVFAAMSLLIMAGADIRSDLLIVGVGALGGLVIESWGTQTEIWTYYTLERPPLWIIPAWPIASLSIDRLVRLLQRLMTKALNGREARKPFLVAYWLIFPGFMALMIPFVWPTADKSLTQMAIGLCFFLVLTPTDVRMAVLTFIAGSGLGYFLERWGTTRLCWTYYTLQTPPLFAVLAHGMAAVAFWRAARLVHVFRPLWSRMLPKFTPRRRTTPTRGSQ